MFDASKHRHLPVVEEDLRTMAISRGQTDVTMGAPVQLIFVVGLHKLTHTTGFQERGLQEPLVKGAEVHLSAAEPEQAHAGLAPELPPVGRPIVPTLSGGGVGCACGWSWSVRACLPVIIMKNVEAP